MPERDEIERVLYNQHLRPDEMITAILTLFAPSPEELRLREAAVKYGSMKTGACTSSELIDAMFAVDEAALAYTRTQRNQT